MMNIENLQNNPVGVLKDLMKSFSTEQNIDFDTPTNPFILGLETSVAVGKAHLDEMSSVTRMLFSSMATSKEDLYHNLTSEEELGMFAIPTETSIMFYFDKLKIEEIGIYDEDSGTHNVTIPKYTEVIVSDLTFTLNHAIRISLSKTGVNVRELLDDTDANINGNIYSVITKNIENADWVTFELKIKQETRIVTEFTTINNVESKFEVPITDMYVNSKAYVNTNGVTVPVDITHSTKVYDHKVLTVIANVSDTKVTYSLPMFYTVAGNNIGKLIIETYTTKGDVTVLLEKFAPDDFSIRFPRDIKTIEESLISKVDVTMISKSVVDGGTNTKSFEELRKEVIFNTTGLASIPVTERTLFMGINDKGFTVSKLEDNIALRSYVVDKNITDDYISTTINSNMDLLNSPIELYRPTIDSDQIYMDDHVIMLSSDTILKESNGVSLPISKLEYDTIKSATIKDVVTMVNSNNYYKLSFNYLLRDNNGSVDTVIYDTDNPSMTYMYIETQNPYISPNVNISQYGIFKTDKGFDIYLTLYGDDEFNKLSKEDVGIQVGFSLGDKKLYFKSVYVSDIDKYKISVETKYVLDKENKLIIDNGESDIYYRAIECKENTEFIIYTTDSKYARDDRYIPTTELYNDDSSNTLSKQFAIVDIVQILDTLWNYSNSKITPIKYELADEDIILRYKDNVYASDTVIDNGIVIDSKDNSYYASKLLHLKDDPVIDIDGNYVYAYKKGDILLDDYGNPIVKQDFGTSYILEGLLMQYEYFALNTDRITEYANTIKTLLRNWLTTELVEFNDVLLEHSRLYFKTSKTTESVGYNYTQAAYHKVIPKITLYVDTNLYVNYNRNDDIYKIGKVLHTTMLRDSFTLGDIREGIIKELGDGIVTVKIENIEPTNAEQITYTTSNRFIMDKLLTMSSEILYNIDFKIETI